MTVLIIDDHVDTRDLTAMVLADEGHTCCVAETFEAALETAQTTKAQVVLLDYHIEGMSVPDFLVKMRNLSPGCRFVLISGDSNVHQIARKLEIEYALAKPYDPDVLLNMVRTMQA